MRKTLFILLLIIVIAGILLFTSRDRLEKNFFKPTDTSLEKGVQEVPDEDIKVIAEDLNIPWEVAFLPSGEILVTERAGTLLIIGRDRIKIPIEGVEHIGEGGLLGLALHPNFSENKWIYLYLTTRTDTGLINRVERYRLFENQLSDKTTIIDNIPGASFHDGGRIAFGPDGYLYVTTGDAGNSASAQDTETLSGKILRLSDDGSIPPGNPFGNAVYSYGHRNAQGLAWDTAGNLWATEHGRSGTRSGFDELNFIEKGQNYGWPVIQGDEEKEGMINPAIHSGPDETWAPAGALYYNGSIFFTGLRGESIYEADIQDGRVSNIRIHLQGKFGRLRAMSIGPNGFFYITTSNTDGRGKKYIGDDKLIRINPTIFSHQDN